MSAAWTPDLLKALDRKRLEYLCAIYFEMQGFTVELTHRGSEGGVDIRLYAPNQGRPSILAHCRVTGATPVGTREVSELAGLIASEMIGEGYLFATGRFAQDARELARGRNVTLVDGDEMLDRFRALPAANREALLRHATEPDYAPPTCPTCQLRMLRREDKEDGRPFWACLNYPRCQAKLKVFS